MGFVALLDANVLYPETLRDVLLTLAEVGVFQVRWSPDILDEVERNVARRAKAANSTAAPRGAAYARGLMLMEEAFPEAAVDPESYRPLIDSMTNQRKDRHVLAAAVVGRADVIVTSNVTALRNGETSCPARTAGTGWMSKTPPSCQHGGTPRATRPTWPCSTDSVIRRPAPMAGWTWGRRPRAGGG